MTLDSPRELEHDVEQLREARPNQSAETDFQVAWRDADPNARPEGVEWDEESAVIRFDLWSAQRETLDTLDTAEHDITAFLSGYGSGKTVLGARWLIEQAGIHAVRANKSLDAGIDEVRNRLMLDDEDRPGLLVSSQCENLRREFLGYKKEHVGGSAAEEHGLDSLRYLIMGEETAEGFHARKAASEGESGVTYL